VADVRPLRPGDVYRLVPPAGDIHAVRTTSAEPSVSVHLLTNDTGFVWRHAFDPATGEVRPFRSGYSNALCLPDDDAPGVSPPA
jgi:predicted metal-dependent enzyme (double-stranded beta helix superfamily)